MSREELIRTIKIWELEHGRICLRQSVEQFLDKLEEYQSLLKEEVEIDFGGACKCKIIVYNNKIEVVAAMDGWGNGISNSDISITNLNQEEK